MRHHSPLRSRLHRGYQTARRAVQVALVISLALLAACGGNASLSRRTAVQPNVIIVVIDCLRADRMHCYGYARETSPTIDQVAREGVRFTDVMAQGSGTAFSVPALLTGRRPGDQGMVWSTLNGKRFATPERDDVTLAKLLEQQGYVTGFVSANPVAKLVLGNHHGFASCAVTGGNGLVEWDLATSDKANACAQTFLESVPRGKPFFLYLHYLDPHALYLPPPEFCRFGRPGYTANDDRLNGGLPRLAEVSRWPPRQSSTRQKLSPQEIIRLSDLYDGEVLSTDFYLGQLLHYLKSRGLYEHTILIITADHGEAFMEHGYLGHSHAALYQEVVHIPLIIRGPNVRRGVVVSQLAGTVDMAPTVLEMVGVSPPPGLAGRSLSRTLVGGQLPEKVIGLSEYPPANVFALRQGSLKLITSPTRTELYDLAKDPLERHDLSKQHTPKVAEMKAQLRSLLKSRRTASVAPRALTAEEKSALRALGYVK